MSKKIALEIFNEIRKKNEETNNTSIPHSDNFIRLLIMSIGIEPTFSKQLIQALIDAHKIFAIEIVAEDKTNNIPRVEGYVECNLKTLRRLKLYFQDELIRLYEAEHYKRNTYHQIIKEVMPVINTLNNTPIGQIVNKAVMMGELERLMEKNFNEYTEEWKESHLDIEINKLDLSTNTKNTNKKNSKSEIIVEDNKADSSIKKDSGKKYFNNFLKSKNYPLDRILKIYGNDFFFQAQLRRHQFVYLTKLVESGKFFNKSDLMRLQNMLFKIKNYINSDLQLMGLREEIFGLERTILFILHNMENNSLVKMSG